MIGSLERVAGENVGNYVIRLGSLSAGNNYNLQLSEESVFFKVEAKVVKNGKGKKINILTYKPKKGSMRRMGHRQPYTKVEITKIVG